MSNLNRMRTLSVFLAFLWSLTAAQAELKTVQLDWEQACGGSLITVTLDDGKPVLIEAFAEHYAEAREWTCLLKGGQVVSSIYRQHALTRRLASEDGDFTIDRKTTRTEVYTAREGTLQGLDEGLQKDFDEVMRLVKNGTSKSQ